MAATRTTTGKGIQFSSNFVVAPQMPGRRSRLVLFTMSAMFAHGPQGFSVLSRIISEA